MIEIRTHELLQAAYEGGEISPFDLAAERWSGDSLTDAKASSDTRILPVQYNAVRVVCDGAAWYIATVSAVTPMSHLVKYGELANFVPRDTDVLDDEALDRLIGAKVDPELLRALCERSDLPLP